MLNQVHDHIVSALGESSRTDTIFVLTAIVFNLIVLGINSSISLGAVEEQPIGREPTLTGGTLDLILAVFIALTVVQFRYIERKVHYAG